MRPSLMLSGVVLAGLIAAGSARADTPCAPGEPHVTVVADGLRSLRGELVVEIYPDDAKKFLQRQAQVSSVHERIATHEAGVCLPLPASGWYAIAVFHDENGDRQFNRNVLGIPSEGFGLSNNPPVRLSMPKFETMRVRLQDGDTVHVRVRYLTGGSGPR